ncbi:MAG: tRNA (guanosine(46)-N7)-methyltransferase TrmB [Oscillospiraceae bacterium]|nr:tRNA (guanosine(46)-N7)-methyltransferase TrmB [Oscillospiraceae bacterium]
MRMCRKPWARPELDASEVYIKNPHDYYGKWQTAFDKEQPLVMELGCGKGGFICQKAFMHPEKNFIAFDIKSEVLAIAKRNIEAVYGSTHCPNVKITAFDIERIPLVVSPQDTVEEIYINFCNPWPKDRHKKRRLTHTRQLNSYKTFLKPDGKIFFKTDDDELFTESLDYFKEASFEIEFITYDMAEKALPENIVTEHEKMFTDQGIKIKGLIAVNKG